MKNKGFVIAAIAVVLIAFGALLFFAKPTSTTSADGVTGTVSEADKAAINGAPTLIRAHNASFGNALSRVTVIEWFDPECESCRVVHPVVTKLMATYKDRVRFVFRYMPYHQNSILAASALEEARELGKYEQALDVLFEKQPEWGNHQNPRPELIATYLQELGIPADKLGRDYLLKKHSKNIRIDESDGNAFGVNGTPTFLINGQILNELSEEALRTAIETALKTP